MIDISGLSKDYGDIKALIDVDVKIKPGRIGLLGPNGAGKSTLLKIISGLIPATTGEVKVFGYSIDMDDVEIRKRLGFMPEGECYDQEMRAIDFVSTMGRAYGMSKSDAMMASHEMLHYLSMGDERYREISTFSQGMRQKIKLAQAMVHSPKLVMCDEPTSGLDPVARSDMLLTIQKLAEANKSSFILSTHILSDVEEVCDSVIMINQGRVKYYEDIRSLLKEDEVSYIIVCDKEDVMESVLESKGVEVVREATTMRAYLKSGQNSRIILEAAANNGISLRQMERGRRDLSDIYLELVESDA